MSVGEVKDAKQRGIRAAERGRDTLSLVLSNMAEAAASVEATVHDSRHPEVEAAIGNLRAAIKALGVSSEHLHKATRSARDYLAMLG